MRRSMVLPDKRASRPRASSGVLGNRSFHTGFLERGRAMHSLMVSSFRLLPWRKGDFFPSHNSYPSSGKGGKKLVINSEMDIPCGGAFFICSSSAAGISTQLHQHALRTGREIIHACRIKKDAENVEHLAFQRERAAGKTAIPWPPVLELQNNSTIPGRSFSKSFPQAGQGRQFPGIPSRSFLSSCARAGGRTATPRRT